MREWADARTRRALAWPAAVGCAYALAFVLVYVVSVRTERGRLVSDAALRGALSSGRPLQDDVEAILDVVSVASLAGAVAAVAVIGLVRLDRVRGLAAVGVLVVANVATQLLKDLLVRPDLGLDEVGPDTLNSLPSGHVTAAFSAVAALLLVLPAAGRVAAALLGGGFAAIVALATMFAGWHRTADAMAAFLLVGVCETVAVGCVVVLGAPRAGAGAGVGSRWWLVSAVALLTVGSAGGLGLSVLGAVRDTLLGSLLAFLAAGLLIVGTVLVVLAGVLRVLQVTERPLEDGPEDVAD